MNLNYSTFMCSGSILAHTFSNVVPNLLPSNPLCLFLFSLVWCFDEQGTWRFLNTKRKTQGIAKDRLGKWNRSFLMTYAYEIRTKAAPVASWDPSRSFKASTLQTLCPPRTSFRNFHCGPLRPGASPNLNPIIPSSFAVNNFSPAYWPVS